MDDIVVEFVPAGERCPLGAWKPALWVKAESIDAADGEIDEPRGESCHDAPLEGREVGRPHSDGHYEGIRLRVKTTKPYLLGMILPSTFGLSFCCQLSLRGHLLSARGRYRCCSLRERHHMDCVNRSNLYMGGKPPPALSRQYRSQIVQVCRRADMPAVVGRMRRVCQHV